MKVLFITDDRESYAAGNYYLAYQRAFLRHANVTLGHPLSELPSPNRFDLVVLGHAALENFARIRGSRFIPEVVRERLWFRHLFLSRLRYSRTPTLLFTKNDYKQFELKNAFIAFVRPELVVTHTRSALGHVANPHGRVIWVPFGVDVEMFSPPESEPSRPFVVGFRANANSEWNDGVRVRFFEALRRLEARWPISLTLAQNGEGFLVGKPYADWMRSCSLLANTVSAAGTVGPRFLEAMACGTVPFAPRHPYEDLLVPDTHYIAIDDGVDGTFPGLEGAISRFLDDRVYRDRLHHHGRELVRAHRVDEHVLHVCRELGV